IRESAPWGRRGAGTMTKTPQGFDSKAQGRASAPWEKAAALVCVAGACAGAAGCDSNFPECMKNLQRIGLALHAYHDDQVAFPMAGIACKDGRRGLSWRVAILPYLGEKRLYDKFKLDEPWDSPHNSQLQKEMPAVFACPSTTFRDPSLTTYRAVVGKNAFLEPA